MSLETQFVFLIIILAVGLDGLLIYTWRKRKQKNLRQPFFHPEEDDAIPIESASMPPMFPSDLSPSMGRSLALRAVGQTLNAIRLLKQSPLFGVCLFIVWIVALLELIHMVSRGVVGPVVFLLFVEAGIFIWLWQKEYFFPETADAIVQPPSPLSLPEEMPPTQDAATPRVRWQDYRIELGLLIFCSLLAVYIWWFSPNTVASRLAVFPPEPPFAMFAVFRGFLNQYGQHWGWVAGGGAGILSLALLGWAIFKQRPRLAVSGLLIGAVGFACLGQLTAQGYLEGNPVNSYLLAVALFGMWVFQTEKEVEHDLFSLQLSRPVEILLLGLILAGTAFARFYKIEIMPFGIEGDESMWTIRAVGAMVYGEYPLDTNLYVFMLPVSFFMQAPFHHWLGPGIISARMAVAFYSVLGSVCFYFLVRKLTHPPLALLSTFLLSASIFDISASRYAHVENHVKLWLVLTLLLLVWAIRSQKNAVYLMAGLGVALSALTYDTAYPVVGVGLCVLAYELWPLTLPLKQKLERVAWFLTPFGVILLIVIPYINSRIDYYKFSENELTGVHLGTYFTALAELLHSLFVETMHDFAYNRPGPVFSSFLLPWLVFGLIFTSLFWKRKGFFWMLCFFLLFFLPAPILTRSPLGRVFYAGLPAAYFLMAVGLLVFYQEIRRVIGETWSPLLTLVSLSCLTALFFFNVYIYFNETHDFFDRIVRRHLYDTARESIQPDTMVYFPYLENTDDVVWIEKTHVIWLGTHSAGMPVRDLHYRTLPVGEFMVALRQNRANYSQYEVVWNVFQDNEGQDRAMALRDLFVCFPDIETIPGEYFTRYRISQEALLASSCME